MEIDLQKEWDEIENEVDPKSLQALLRQFSVTIEEIQDQARKKSSAKKTKE